MIAATGMTLALSTLFLGCAARGPASGVALQAPADPSRAALGVRVLTLDEGIVVQRVHPGTGAAEAGLGVGDMIVSVDGQEVRSDPEAARMALRGPSGSSVALVVRAPLTGEYREAQVLRGVSRDLDAAPRLAPAVRTLRTALRKRGPRAVRRALEAAAAAGWGGEGVGEALARPLVTAARSRPRAGRAAASWLEETATGGDDPVLQEALGRAWHALGEQDRAAVALERSLALRPPDLWAPAAAGAPLVGDAGGHASARALLAGLRWERGERDAAIAAARELLRSADAPALRATLGMAPVATPTPWRAALPPVGPLSVTTLDGATWDLADHDDQVVLLSFFATWCGPCREELPALQALADELPALSVLAVSTDDPEDVASLPAYVADLELDVPVAHAPALARRFQVTGLPSVRLLDRSGALVHVGSGWSPAGMLRLERIVRDALVDNAGLGEAVVGEAWTAPDARASLVGFLGMAGADDVVVAQGEVAVGRDHAPPLVLARRPAEGTGLHHAGGGERVAWLDGPVTARPGEPWVRAWTPGGRLRSTLTTPGPVADLAASGETAWVATAEVVVGVDRLGRVLHQLPGGALDLAPHPDGGAWAVDGAVLRHIGADGTVQASWPAPGAVQVDAAGRVAAEGFTDLVTGRFGPGGALRSVLARADGTVVGLDGQGRAAFTWTLDDPAGLAVADADQDGLDELIVAVRRQGLATVALSLP